MRALLFLLALAGVDGPSARWSLSVPSVQVGEPFELVLSNTEEARVLAHSSPEPALELDGSWAVLEERSRPWSRTFVVLSLEPGRRELPRGALSASAIQFGLEWTPEALVLDVAPALAANENAPRPMRGLRALPAREVPSRAHWAWLGLCGVLAAASLGLVLWLRAARAGRRAESVAPDPLERLERLGASLARAEGDALVAGHHELAGLVRERATCERSFGAALTDEECLAHLATSARVSPEERDRCARLFSRLARVRFGGERPSSFAVDEALREARSVLLAFRSPGGVS